ncbi:MAG: sulfurtransferase [Gomphosphaeria aponina SAG 52.96 = DSM 107014]|uniref:Sulfurtransferase n=1 Tax=Gomphosphaeria aponina SAG 52.96 = DSM 107014 TaxID=1521640 RepID=A0A941GW62_9CHRO|nr:sulfurtransferase [Gomphosphaeria aponina SAG 52.96 = DSM 107014]
MTNFIVSPQWLSEQLNNPQIIIADCRFLLSNPEAGYQEYLHTHLPGAYYLSLDQDLSAPVKEHGGRHPLPDPELLAAKLENMGIVSGETLVVAYDDSRFAFAARLWWLLRYLGHTKVALLDGGFSAWKNQGYPTTDEIPAPKGGKFLPQPQPDWVVDIETVKTRKELGNVVLVDSRESDRFLGKQEPIDPIAGHIPGAVNSPWKQVSNDLGFLLPTPTQKQLWVEVEEAEEIIVYCGSGVTACVNLLSLEIAGLSEKVKLYPGGWSDWCSYLTRSTVE